jgi:hypothetical protein
MSNCCDEGQLRAYLDGELPAIERAALGAHIGECQRCRAALEALAATAAQARALLAAPVPAPDAQAALARLRRDAPSYQQPQAAAQPARGQGTLTRMTRRPLMPSQLTFWAGRRSWLAGLAAIAVILSLLALPPVRAAADQLLSVFRVQKIVFMPISPERIQQLQGLNIKGDALFVGQPQHSNQAAPRTVASADEAAQAAGYSVAHPGKLPGPATSTDLSVVTPGTMRFQINVATARQVLDLLDIRDVTIPDELSTQPIVVEAKPFVVAHYRGANYDLTLSQGPSPSVTLPKNTNLEQLGKVALRVLGMTPEQAEVASGQINWSNTLLFPFPADSDSIRQVSVNREPALLISGGARRNAHWQLYWQVGDRLYMLAGKNDGTLQTEEMVSQMVATAESVQ